MKFNLKGVNKSIGFLKFSFGPPTRGRVEQTGGSYQSEEESRPSLSVFCFKQFVSLKFPSSAGPGPVDTMQSVLPHIR